MVHTCIHNSIWSDKIRAKSYPINNSNDFGCMCDLYISVTVVAEGLSTMQIILSQIIIACMMVSFSGIPKSYLFEWIFSDSRNLWIFPATVEESLGFEEQSEHWPRGPLAPLLPRPSLTNCASWQWRDSGISRRFLRRRIRGVWGGVRLKRVARSVVY